MCLSYFHYDLTFNMLALCFTSCQRHLPEKKESICHSHGSNQGLMSNKTSGTIFTLIMLKHFCTIILHYKVSISSIAPDDGLSLPGAGPSKGRTIAKFRSTLKWKNHQNDCPGHHWGRWRQTSMSPVTTRAVTPMTFMFLCNVMRDCHLQG